jgi:predicted O-methyltransferase YrrM
MAVALSCAPPPAEDPKPDPERGTPAEEVLAEARELTPPADPAESLAVDAYRKEGRLRFQTMTEEASATGVPTSALTGDAPVFTTDWVSDNTASWAVHLAEFKGRPGVRALEVGSFEGRSAIWFAEHVLTGPGSTLTCVDVFGERLDEFFDHNVAVAGVEARVRKLTGRSQQVLRNLPDDETFDFIYVDGCHLATCALVDIVLSWDRLEDGGLLIIDDYEWEGPALDRPKMAVDAFLEIFGPHLEVVEKSYQVTLRKKEAGY